MAKPMGDLRIVLLGKTGSGKSATGNTILGTEEFQAKMSTKSVTETYKSFDAVVNGQNVRVIDTPGLWDTETNPEENKCEIEKFFNDSGKGVVILMVIRLDVRLTKEEQDTIKWIQENFSEKATKHTIVLFTHGDALPPNGDIEGYINDDEKLKSLVEKYGGRYHVFNNKAEHSDQGHLLLQKVNALLTKNKCQGFTKEEYDSAQKELAKLEKLKKDAKQKGILGATIGGITGAAGGGTAGGVIAAKVGLTVVKVALCAGGGAILGAAVLGIGFYFGVKKIIKNNNKKDN